MTAQVQRRGVRASGVTTLVGGQRWRGNCHSNNHRKRGNGDELELHDYYAEWGLMLFELFVVLKS